MINGHFRREKKGKVKKKHKTGIRVMRNLRGDPNKIRTTILVDLDTRLT